MSKASRAAAPGPEPADTESNVSEATQSKITDLEIQLEQAKSIVEGFQKENSSLKESLEDANTTIAEITADKEALKSEIEVLLKGDGAAAKAKGNGVGEHFDFEDKQYVILVPATHIPGIGKRTALELLADTEAQKWLVENKSGIIKEKV